MNLLKLNPEITGGLLLLRPAIETPGFTIAFTTRVELSPRGPRFCNFGFYGRPGAAKSRKKLCEALGLPPRRLTVGEQVHSATVAVVGEEHAGRGGLKAALRIPKTDGLTTCIPGTPLAVMTADCVPVIITDPERRAAAAVHAGWRGSAGGILQNAVAAMRSSFGSSPRNLIAFIGPHIGPCCYVIGPELAEKISEPSALSHSEKGISLNLALWNVSILRSAGLLSKNIHATDLCTSCHTELLYSYRADKKNIGSNASLVSIDA